MSEKTAEQQRQEDIDNYWADVTKQEQDNKDDASQKKDGRQDKKG